MLFSLLSLLLPALLLVNEDVPSAPQAEQTLDWVEVSGDKTQFVEKTTGKPLLFWGVNYDHDSNKRLMDDYWLDEWDTVVEDFDEMKAMGLNVVRIHLQVGRFMDSPTSPNKQALEQLSKLIQVAHSRGLYLYITGLACYKKPNIPAWYDDLDENARWAVQATFWKHIAQVCASSPAVFCYDLMNEPLVPGKQIDDWLTPEGLNDLFFVQYITRTPNGRDSHTIAKAWIDHLVAAIRSEDQRHLITVGVIPWALVWPSAKPLFYDPIVAENLDFASVHFYPEKGEIEKALRALAVYSIGKPLVIAEMFPLRCGFEEMGQFIEGSRPITQGWMSFYWGKTVEEYSQIESPTIADSIIKKWLEFFEKSRP